jgi:ankyrin repeat protein
MTANGIIDRVRAAVMQEWLAKPQTPQGGRPDFVCPRCPLFDSISRADIVEQEVGVQMAQLAVEHRIGAAPRLQRGHVTDGATDRAEDLLSLADLSFTEPRHRLPPLLIFIDAFVPFGRILLNTLGFLTGKIRVLGGPATGSSGTHPSGLLKEARMLRRTIVQLSLSVLVCAGFAPAQTSAKVDFAKDVLPLFKQNCFGCHGPAQQINGLRLDRKSSALMGGRRRIVPGSSANSFLYHRLIGTEFGLRMPPAGPLRPEQVATIKDWIDQGADWPASLSNEAELPPLDPQAITLVEALRSGDTALFSKMVAEDPKLLNDRGPEGSTPFMYAVLYNGAPTLARLLKQGADPNRHNNANATALMWAAQDLEKTRLLLDHGANPNARSDDLRTPLMIAARRQGAAPVVKLLLDRKANPNPNSKPASESSPLLEAATAGDPATVQLLIERGADVKAVAPLAMLMATAAHCSKCLDLLVAKTKDPLAFTMALPDVASTGDLDAVRLMLDHGADVNMVDPLGRTPLMYAAGSDLVPTNLVKLLIERGANVNARNEHQQAGDTGLTVLDIARLRGETPVVQLLLKAGAKASPPSPPALQPRPQNTIPEAIQASLPLLQRADANFTARSGCISCHNDSLAAMTLSAARKAGFRVDEELAARQVKINAGALEQLRDRMHQGFFVAVGDFFAPSVVAYILLGLDAENHKPDLSTDAVAMFLKQRQSADGHWDYPSSDTRPPICSDYIGQTALAMRGLQLYAPRTDKAAYDKSVQLAAVWLAKAQSSNNEDRGWRLIGLAWAGNDKAATQKAMRELLDTQRPDGGWSDLESMETNAYATGKSLVALQTAGLSTSDPAYQRGVRYLLNTQQQDGSWYVKTRALAFQPFFDSGFPHGFDQWISAAGSNWATMALALAAPSSASATTARLQ